MQIFALDQSPKLCAEYHADKHVIKQILETAQLLSTTCRLNGLQVGYKSTHMNHPCRKWLDESVENYIWACELGFELGKEYTYRYDKVHKSIAVIQLCFDQRNNLNLPKINLTPFAQAMPDEYKNECPITAYRHYYKQAKAHILSYKNRSTPLWLTNH